MSPREYCQLGISVANAQVANLNGEPVVTLGRVLELLRASVPKPYEAMWRAGGTGLFCWVEKNGVVVDGNAPPKPPAPPPPPVLELVPKPPKGRR